MSALICDESTGIRFVPMARLDSLGVASLREALVALGTGAAGDVTLDFSDVAVIDGAAVAALAFLYRRLKGKGFRLSLIGVSGQPLVMLHELGVAALLGLPAARPHAGHAMTLFGMIRLHARQARGAPG